MILATSVVTDPGQTRSVKQVKSMESIMRVMGDSSGSFVELIIQLFLIMITLVCHHTGLFHVFTIHYTPHILKEDTK